MNDFISGEIHLTRGLIHLKKVKKEKTSLRTKAIRIAFEEDDKFQAMTLSEDEISAARKNAKFKETDTLQSITFLNINFVG